jgi:thioredoxin-like negative regulator of GroEL
LQNLAALRHAQQRFAEAASITSELLRLQPRDAGMRRTLQLMLAECALETNDLYTAHAALSQIGPALPLRETLKLLELQVEYCVRISAWPQAMDQLPAKAEMAELMPAEPAARVQGLLALAALKAGRPDWSTWLRRRAELLTDVRRLIERRPMLRELWSAGAGAQGEAST